jgi:hypothetical protein
MAKNPNTIRAYRDDVATFRRFTGKPLRATYLSDLQRYADSLVGAPAMATRSRGIAFEFVVMLLVDSI